MATCSNSDGPRSPEHGHPPDLLTPDEAAALLRTTRKAIYALNARGQLPGAIRIGRRLLVDRAVLLRSLAEGCVVSPGGSRR